MNGFFSRYVGLEGRISRKDWWIGTIVLIVVGIIISIPLGAVGLGMMPNVAAIAAESGDPAAISAAAASASQRAAWVSLAMFVIFAYPSFALSMKRRRDRDNNGLDLKIYYGLAFILLLVQALGIGYMALQIADGITIPVPSPILVVVNFVIGIFALYLLVVLGFLKGSQGPNSYGADPLTAA